MNPAELLSRRKVVNLSDLSGIGGILVHGCFDLLHLGHLRYISWARTLADIYMPLTVTITADAYICKGDGRPAFNQDIRAEWLSYIEPIDWVAIVDGATAVPAIEAIKPNIYCKGLEYKTVEPEEREAVESHDGCVEYCPFGHMYSSTEILTGEYLRGNM